MKKTASTSRSEKIITEIASTGYFEDSDIIPLVVEAATQYTQGYLLITPDIDQPVGERWTTNGYLQRPHLRLDATYDTEAEAAKALLNAINATKAIMNKPPRVSSRFDGSPYSARCHSGIGRGREKSDRSTTRLSN